MAASTEIKTKQQAAATPRRAPGSLKQQFSASPVGNPHQTNVDSKVTKPKTLSDKVAQKEKLEKYHALFSGHRASTSTAPRATKPRVSDTPQANETIQSSIERASIVPSEASTSTTNTSKRTTRERYHVWGDGESLQCWEMYWDASFKPINRDRKVSQDMRANLHNQWRRTHGLTGNDRTWASMEQHTFTLRDLGVTLEDLRAKVKAEDDAKEGEMTVGRAEKVVGGGAEIGPPVKRKLLVKQNTKASPHPESDTHATTDQQMRLRLEDQKDIATANSVVHAMNMLVNHAQHVMGADPKDIKIGLLQGVEDYKERVRKRDSETPKEPQDTKVATPQERLKARMEVRKAKMAAKRKQAEDDAASEKGASTDDPPWKHWR